MSIIELTKFDKLLNHLNKEFLWQIVIGHEMNNSEKVRKYRSIVHVGEGDVCSSLGPDEWLAVIGYFEFQSKTERSIANENPYESEWQKLLEEMGKVPPGHSIEDLLNRDVVMYHLGSEDIGYSTFEEWLKMMIESDIIPKLDCKEPSAAEKVLKGLKGYGGPVIVNGDFVKGPGGYSPIMDPEKFISMQKEYCPEAILSLGWTQLKYIHSGYNGELIDQMLEITKNIKDEFTVVANLFFMKTREAVAEFVRFFDDRPNAFLTLYHNTKTSNHIGSLSQIKNWLSKHYEAPYDKLANLLCNKTLFDISDKSGKPVWEPAIIEGYMNSSTK